MSSTDVEVIYNKEILGQITRCKEIFLGEDTELQWIKIQPGKYLCYKANSGRGVKKTKRDGHARRRCSYDLLLIYTEGY